MRSRGVDMYDVLAVLMTISGAPPKFAVCLLGILVGNLLFTITLGSADRASAAVMAEGCGQNWHVKGKDIRPEGSQSMVVDD